MGLHSIENNFGSFQTLCERFDLRSKHAKDGLLKMLDAIIVLLLELIDNLAEDTRVLAC